MSKGVAAAFSFDRIRRIGNNRIERLVIPVLWINKRIAMRHIEMVVVDVVKEHVYPAEIEYLGKFQKKRARRVPVLWLCLYLTSGCAL